MLSLFGIVSSWAVTFFSKKECLPLLVRFRPIARGWIALMHCERLMPILLELDRCLSLVASALGRGGLPKSSPPYDSRFVARVDVNEGWL